MTTIQRQSFFTFQRQSFFTLGLFVLNFYSIQKVQAQELIHNGGFEILRMGSPPPDRAGFWFKCEGWDEIDWIIDPFNPKTNGSADYYMDSAEWNLDTLKYHKICDVSSFKGAATMGMIAFSLWPGNPNDREYIATKLLTTLEVGGYYEITLWVSNCHNIPTSGSDEFPGFGCNGLGIAFTSTRFATEGHTVIDFKPQISVSEEIWNFEWKKYSFGFLADSAYQYLTLGFFLNDLEISYSDHQPDEMSQMGYYFFDEVSMHRLPNIIGDTVICEGETAVLKAWNEDSLYLWAEASDPGKVVCSTRTLSVSPDTTTTYILNPGLTQMSVTVRVVPKAVKVLENDTTICKGDAVQISIPSKYNDIRWQDGSSEYDVLLTEEGLYWVDIIDKQCISGDTMLLDVRLCTCEAIIPNSFTPNGDGLNDVFMPILSCPVFDFYFVIYNRWGGLVFESTSDNVGWNGIDSNGSKSDGHYVYRLEYSLADGTNHSHKGTIVFYR